MSSLARRSEIILKILPTVVPPPPPNRDPRPPAICAELLRAAHLVGRVARARGLPAKPRDRNADLSEQAQAPAPGMPRRAASACNVALAPALAASVACTHRSDALPLVGKLLLLEAGEDARVGVAGVVEVAGRALLVLDVLIVLSGDRRGEALRQTAAKRRRVGPGEVTTRRGERPLVLLVMSLVAVLIASRNPGVS
jgi:hypothetical protein